MKTFLVVSVYLLGSVSAGEFWPRATTAGEPAGGQGFGQAGGCFGEDLSSEQEQQSQQLFESAGRNPNKTASASFTFAPGYSTDSDSTWTWHVNITDVPVPDDFYDTSGLHAINEQWSLQWPGGGSLQSFMARSGLDGLCFTAAELVMPSNVTSRYSGSVNCSSLLGNDCVDKLLASSTCQSPPDFMGTVIEECKDTLISQDGSTSESFSFYANSTSYTSLQSEDTVWFDTSPGTSASNFTKVLVGAETRLNIMLLQERLGSAQAMVCQVVDPAASSGVSYVGVQGHGIWLVLATMTVLFLL